MKLKKKEIDLACNCWFAHEGGKALRTLFQQLPYHLRLPWLKEIMTHILTKYDTDNEYEEICQAFKQNFCSSEIPAFFQRINWSKENNIQKMIQDVLYHALKLAYNSKEQEKGQFVYIYDETADYALGDALMVLLCKSNDDMLTPIWNTMLQTALELQRNSRQRNRKK